VAPRLGGRINWLQPQQGYVHIRLWFLCNTTPIRTPIVSDNIGGAGIKREIGEMDEMWKLFIRLKEEKYNEQARVLCRRQDKLLLLDR